MPREQILSTKLAGPEPHPLAVDRGPALDWLDAELTAGGAVVLSTLAGSGRLELLARWARDRSPHPTVWLRLDAWDDLGRYSRHLISALQGVDPRIGADVLEATTESASVQRDVVLPAVVADCHRYGEPLTLVVDGVDRLEDPIAIGALRATQRYRPDNLRLVWLSEDDGPADFQTADGVTHVPHIDPRLLAFAPADVQEMHRAIGVDVSESEASGFVAATDGWALAVLHGIDAARVAGQHVRFDATDQTLAARIDRAVVSGLDPELRTLASDLAVIGPATAAQIEQMTDRSGASILLEELLRRHVVSRTDGRWSVVRPVQAHLAAQREVYDAPEAVVLRRRMARAAADAGDVQGALGILAEAGDFDARARLLLERHRQWSGEGDPAILAHAEDALVHDPSLAELHLVRAWYAAFNDDDLDHAAAFVDAVERIPLEGARAIRAHSEIEFLRAVLARRAGRLADSAEHARAGVSIGSLLAPTPESELTRWPYVAVVPTTASLYLGHCLFHAGELAEARSELLRANAERLWSPPAMAAIHGALGLIGWIEDDPSARIHGAIAASNLGDHLNSSNHLAAAALALASTGPDADQMGRRYREEAPGVGEPTADFFGHLVAARDGRAEDVSRSLAAARRVVDGCEQPGVLSVALARAATLLDLPDDAPDLGQPLTDGERRVVLALRGDLTEREIAGELHLSHNTVRTYRRRAYRKLGVSSRIEAIARVESLDPDSHRDA